MKTNRFVSIILALVLVTTCFVGCTAKKKNASADQQAVTQLVTNENGEFVTNAKGEVVTELVNANQPTATPASVSTTAKGKAAKNTNSKGKAGVSSAKAGDKKSSSGNAATTKPAPKPITITLSGSCDAKCSSPKVSIAKSNARGEIYISHPVKKDKSGKKIPETTPTEYVIKGNGGTWHGQIIIELENCQKASVRFENVNITNDTKNIIRIMDKSITSNRSFIEAEAAIDNPTADNALQTVADNDKAPNVSLSFPSGTSSSFKTTANAFTGVIYNEAKLQIKGNGTVSIISERNANNCICSTKSITIKNATVNLQTAMYNSTENLAKSSGSAKGIFSYSKVTLESGMLDIKSNGDGIRCDRFYGEGGTAKIVSSACDGIDADDSIIITGGKYTTFALKKYAYKVRRVNNTEDPAATGGIVRAGKSDCFRINGGTVVGESKRITSLMPEYQSDGAGSKQTNITCKAVKSSAGTEAAINESKVPVQFKIGGVKTSTNQCIKFLYSASGIARNKNYSVNGVTDASKCSWQWSGAAGVASLISSQNK